MIFILKNINNYFSIGCKLQQNEEKEFYLDFPEGKA